MIALKALFKDTAIYGCADFAFKFINFATFPLFAYALSIEEFGVYALAIVFSNFVGIFFNCGLNNALQKYYLDPFTSINQRPYIVTTGLICLLINAVLVCIVLFAGFWFYRDLQHNIVFPMVLWVFLNSLGLQFNTYCMDIIRLQFRPWRFTLLLFLQNGYMVGLGLFFVLKMQWGAFGYLLGTALGYLLNAPLCLWMIRRELAVTFDRKIALSLLRFGYPFIFVGIAYWLFGSMDRWMLEEMSDLNQVGLYSIAFKIGNILIFINMAFGQAWSPRALELYRNDPSYRLLYSKFLTSWFFILIAVSTTLALFCREILMLLTPESYWPAAHLMPAISLSLAFFGITQILAMPLTLEGKTVHYLWASWLAAGVNFVLNWVLIPSYGAQGATFSTLCANIALCLYYGIATQKLHPLPLEYRKLLLCLALAGCSLGFGLWINHLSWTPMLILYKGFFLMGTLSLCLLNQNLASLNHKALRGRS